MAATDQDPAWGHLERAPDGGPLPSAAPAPQGNATGRLRGEVQSLVRHAGAGWRRGRRPWLGVVAAAATLVIYLVPGSTSLGRVLWGAGDVSAALPALSELGRLTMSIFLPTPYLPEWGALLQLLVVLGLGQLILGTWLTLLAAGVGQLAATFAARLLLDSSVGHFVGLPHLLVHALDTGPSAVTVAVGTCLLVASSCECLTAILTGALVVAACVGPGLDGPEHLVALVCGVVVGVLGRRGSWHRQLAARPVGARPRPGLPTTFRRRPT